MSTIYISKSKQTQSGFINLYLRIRTHRTITKPLNIKLHHTQWSIKRKRVINHKFANELNRKINDALFNATELVYSHDAKIITLEQLTRQLTQQQSDIESILFDHIINTKSSYQIRQWTAILNQYKSHNKLNNLILTEYYVNAYIKSCANKSNATQRSYLNVLKTITNEAYRLGLIDTTLDNNKLIRIKYERTEVKSIEPKDIIAKMKESDSSTYDHWVLFVFSLVTRGLYYTDVIAFDTDNDIHRRVKTGVPMLYDTNKELLSFLHNQIDIDRINRPYFRMQQTRHAYGLKLARKTFESVALSIGVERTIRRTLLGHALEGVDKHYTNTNAKSNRELLNKEWNRTLDALQIDVIMDTLRDIKLS